VASVKSKVAGIMTVIKLVAMQNQTVYGIHGQVLGAVSK